MACSNHIRAELNGIPWVALPRAGAVPAALLAAVVAERRALRLPRGSAAGHMGARGWCPSDRVALPGGTSAVGPSRCSDRSFFPLFIWEKKKKYIYKTHVFKSEECVVITALKLPGNKKSLNRLSQRPKSQEYLFTR